MPLIPTPYTVPGEGANVVLSTSEENRNAELTNTVNSIGLTTPVDLIEEPKTSQNVITLSSGDFAGVKMKKEFTQLKSLGGARFTSRAIFNSTTMVEGVTFTNSDESVGILVEVSSAAKVMFRNCHFRLTKPDGAPVWVDIEDGAKVIFVGCVWSGNPAAGHYVRHTGAAANVQVVASFAAATAPGPVFGNSQSTAVI
jgi:hypothetical protein